MFKNIFGQLEAFWRQIERLGSEERTLLVVTALPSLQLNLRILAIQERWHILFAKNLNSALQISRLNRITVVIYDRELSDADWRNAARGFTGGGTPVFFILLSSDLAGCGKRLFRSSKRQIGRLAKRRINNLRSLVGAVVGGPETFSAAC